MKSPAIKTAKRLFEVFEYFDEMQRPLSLSELSSHFGYPVSSTAALLKSLVMLGYLDYDRYSRNYMPTMRITMLGGWVHGALFDEGGILGLMRHMSIVTGEMISLGTQSDLFAQYIHTIPSRYPMQMYIKPGSVRSIMRSGLGWLLLSARADQEIEMLIRRANAEEPDPQQRMQMADIMSRVSMVREQGYVFSKHTVVPGEGIIGMLLPVRRHGRVLAIGIGGRVKRLEAEQTTILHALGEGIARLATQDAEALSQ